MLAVQMRFTMGMLSPQSAPRPTSAVPISASSSAVRREAAPPLRMIWPAQAQSATVTPKVRLGRSQAYEGSPRKRPSTASSMRQARLPSGVKSPHSIIGRL